MFGTISRFIKFNNFVTQHLNGARHLFVLFCCTTQHIFEPLRVFEPGFNMDKYGIPMFYNRSGILKQTFFGVATLPLPFYIAVIHFTHSYCQNLLLLSQFCSLLLLSDFSKKCIPTKLLHL